jgi:hypothetical protein
VITKLRRHCPPLSTTVLLPPSACCLLENIPVLFNSNKISNWVSVTQYHLPKAHNVRQAHAASSPSGVSPHVELFTSHKLFSKRLVPLLQWYQALSEQFVAGAQFNMRGYARRATCSSSSSSSRKPLVIKEATTLPTALPPSPLLAIIDRSRARVGSQYMARKILV